MQNPDYSKMTQEDFDTILNRLVTECQEELILIPGVYEVVSEYFNNAVLAMWALENPDLCYPEK